MKKIIGLAAFLGLLAVSGEANAAGYISLVDQTNPTYVACVTSTGYLCVHTDASSGSTVTLTSPVYSSTPATTPTTSIPGGVYRSTPATVTDGQGVADQIGPHGEKKVCPVDSTGACADPTLAVPVNPWATSSASAATSRNQTSVAGSNVVLKSGAGNLYGVNIVTGGSAGYLMVFDATAAPGDGTVTPIKVYVVAANSSFSIAPSAIPLARCSTGITLVFSTTGPFSKTASATAFISGDYL